MWLVLPLLFALAQEPPAPEPAPKEAAAQIAAALKDDDVDAAAAVLDELGRRDAKEIVAAVAPALEHRDPTLRAAALAALRYNPNAAAVDALLRVKKAKAWNEDPEARAEYFYALGQKADARALAILTEDMKSAAKKDDPVMRARVHALGRVRSKAALEALVALLSASGGRSGRHPYWNEIHLALQALTGAEHGEQPNDWIAWWNDAKKDYPLPQDPPKLPPAAAEAWDALWADPYAEPADPVADALGGLGRELKDGEEVPDGGRGE